jgi:hypothetical protein
MKLISDVCNPQALKILLATETAKVPVSIKWEKCTLFDVNGIFLNNLILPRGVDLHCLGTVRVQNLFLEKFIDINVLFEKYFSSWKI